MVLQLQVQIWYYSSKSGYDIIAPNPDMILQLKVQIWYYRQLQVWIWYYSSKSRYDIIAPGPDILQLEVRNFIKKKYSDVFSE